MSERPRQKSPVPSPSTRRSTAGSRSRNELGIYFQIERAYPLHHHHGSLSLERLTGVSRATFSILTGSDNELDLTRTLFLDTETTGLAGGPGTCPFLVGVGFVEDGQFIVRQLFMRDYHEEAAMLAGLAGLLRRYESLVTYNGKTFDIPLLESRFVLARQSFAFEDLPHFDMLHPARSLWKARFESCRLSELEYLLLGLEREGDVPGHLIPDLYFGFLRSADARRIAPIFTHNRYDILSLASLTVAAADMLAEGHEPQTPIDDYSLGRLFDKAAQPERSMKHFSRALASGLSGSARRHSLHQLAKHHKRRGEWNEAIRMWEELAAEPSVEGVQALAELAKYYEHRCRDFDEAFGCSQRALRMIEETYALPLTFRERWQETFFHRQRRLKRRSAGASENAAEQPSLHDEDD